MTLSYRLSRNEHLRFLLLGMRHSARLRTILLIVVAFSALQSFMPVAGGGGGLTIAALWSFLKWTLGAVLLLLATFWAMGKTDERVLTVTEQGFVTRIGALAGEVPWKRIALVRDAGQVILVVGTNGNAFYIPDRAFSGSEQKQEFLADVDRFRSLR